SIAVKVTVADPLAPQPSLTPLKLLLQVTLPLHWSLATAPPWAESQLFNAVVLPLPSHSTVWLVACWLNTGATVSWIVKVAVLPLVLPQASIAVKVTVADPLAPQPSLNAVKLLLQVTLPLHWSLATAPPWAVSHAFNAALLPAPSHSTVW